MYLSSYYKTVKGKKYGPYYAIKESLGYGRQVTLSLRRDMPPLEALAGGHPNAPTFLRKRAEWLDKKQKLNMESNSVPVLPRRTAFSPVVAELLKAAGWNLQGRRLQRSRKTYYTPAAAAVRYEMLDPDSKALVGSVQGLRLLEEKARSMMKKASSKHISGFSFEHAMATLIHK